MSADDEEVEIKRARAKIVRLGAKLGILLGLICHSLPAHYQQPCGAILGAISLTCGAK